MTGHPFSWPRLSMGHLQHRDHYLLLRGLQWAPLLQKQQKWDELLHIHTCTQRKKNKGDSSFYINHKQLERKDMMYLITHWWAYGDLVLQTTLFLLATSLLLINSGTYNSKDFVHVSLRKPERQGQKFLNVFILSECVEIKTSGLLMF